MTNSLAEQKSFSGLAVSKSRMEAVKRLPNDSAVSTGKFHFLSVGGVNQVHGTEKYYRKSSFNLNLILPVYCVDLLDWKYTGVYDHIQK